MCSVCMYVCMYVYMYHLLFTPFLTFVFKINGCYRHELWKDYENSEYTGNWNFTKTQNRLERKFRNYIFFYFKNGNNLLSHTDFFWGRSADGKQTIF